MEFQLNKHKFENALSLLQPFLDKKDFTEITSHIYISTVNNILEIKAHDYESGLIIKIEDESLKIIDEGKATVNGTKIFTTIKALKNDIIKIKTDGNNLIMSQKRSNLKLPMFNPEQYKFPNLEDSELQNIEIEIDTFVSSIKKVLPTADTNNIKQELNGVLIDMKTSTYNIVSTDTKRLAKVELKDKKPFNTSIIIPRKSVSELQKIFNSNASIKFSKAKMIIENENYLFYTKLIEGNFPDYDRIIPKEFNHKISISRDKLLNEINLISAVSSQLKIIIKPNEVELNSINNSIDDESEAKTGFEMETGVKEDISICTTNKHITDFISCISSEEFIININDTNLPFVMEDDEFITVTMPFIE